MTSQDSLIPSPPERSETDALRDRINRAVIVARGALSDDADMFRRDPLSLGQPARHGLTKVIAVLEGKL